MNYAIFRSEPIYTLNDLAQIGSHNKREKKAYNSNPDIKLELTKNNIELVPLDSKYVKGFHEITKEYKLEHDERMKTEREDRKRTYSQMLDRSKNVVADEMIFTASPGFFKGLKSKDIKKWADTCMEFVYQDLGYKKEQVLHATLHMDEKTPHIHCVVIPLVKKLDKRTNTERYTISKKQFIHDKEHLSELQDEYCEYLNMCGFALERGTKHSDKEHINIKEFKKLTKSLTNELDLKDDKLSKSIDELEEKMKSNKTIMFDKESVKVKKETFDSMYKVVEEAKKVKDLKPKLNNAYKNLKEVTNDYSKIHQQNMKLEDENRNLKYENTNLRHKAFTLSNTIDTLKNVINKMANFVYHLVADGLIPRHKEDEFNDEFEEFISGKKKNKDKDDSLVL